MIYLKCPNYIRNKVVLGLRLEVRGPGELSNTRGLLVLTSSGSSDV